MSNFIFKKSYDLLRLFVAICRLFIVWQYALKATSNRELKNVTGF